MSKYRLLFEKLEADFRTFENSQQARINVRNAEIAGKQEELMQQLRVEEEKVRVTQEEKVQQWIIVSGSCAMNRHSVT